MAYNEPKKCRSDHNSSQIIYKARLPLCVHMRFEYEVKIQIEIRKNEQGMAVMPLILVTTCLMF